MSNADLYEVEHDSLYRVSYLLTRDVDRSREIVEEAFAAAEVKGRRIGGPDSSPAFVRRCVLTQSGNPRRHIEVSEPRSDGVAPSIGALAERVVALPESQRHALVLRHGLDLSDESIADVLLLSPSEVTALLRRGVNNLQTVLERDEPPSDLEITSSLRHVTETVQAPERDWNRVQSLAAGDRAQSIQRRKRTRIAAVVVMSVVVSMIAVGVSRNDGRTLRPASTAGNVATANTTVTSGDPSSATSYDPAVEGIWPISSNLDLTLYRQSGSTEYAAPASTAAAFLKTFGGLEGAVLGVFTSGAEENGRLTGDIPAGAPSSVSLPMTVLLAQVYPGGPWTVTGVRCVSLFVDQPTPHAAIASPLQVSGQAQATSGVVNIEVRQDGNVRDQNLGTTIATAGKDRLVPFTSEVRFGQSAQPGGSIVLREGSSVDGSTVRLAVSRIRFGG